jgi:uncharacterized protein HemX
MPILMLLGSVFKMIPWQLWAILGVLASVYVFLHVYAAEIKKEVYATFYQQEVEQQLKNKQTEIDALNELIKAREEAIVELNKHEQKTIADLNTIRKQIDTKKVQPGADAPVADVLKQTIENLRTVNTSKTAGKP